MLREKYLLCAVESEQMIVWRGRKIIMNVCVQKSVRSKTHYN
jgi:hypothetical protein